MTDKELDAFGKKQEQFVKDQLESDKRFVVILFDYDNPEFAICSNMKRNVVETIFKKLKYNAKEYTKNIQ